MPSISAEEFFAVLEQSKLLSPEQLADARKAAPNGEDAVEVARALARSGVITRWQAGQLLAGRSRSSSASTSSSSCSAAAAWAACSSAST